MRRDPLRVLLLSHSAEIGGAELGLIEMVQALTRQGAHVHVALPDDGPLHELLRQAGISSTPVPALSWWISGSKSFSGRARDLLLLVISSIRSTRHLRSTIRRTRPDVVVTQTLSIPQGALAAKIVGVPHVWYVHEFGDKDHGHRFLLSRTLTLRMIGCLSTSVLACSRTLAAMLSQYVHVAKVRIVYHAVELPRPATAHTSDGSGQIRLLAIGRLHPGKGQEDAVRAVGVLAARGTDVSLRVIGPDSHGYGVVLDSLVRQLGLDHRVELQRTLSEDPQLEIENCDIVLMCSRSEGFGRVTVEAMKAGRPVIAARSGASPELLDDGARGLLYESRDAESLADQIERLSSDPSFRQRIAARGQRWAERQFNLDRCGHDLIEVLQEARATRRS